MLIADKIGRKGGQLSIISLRTLQSPCIIPCLVPTDLRDLFVSLDMLLDATSF